MQDTTSPNRSPPVVPVWLKLCLTVKEAAAYSGIGEHQLRHFADDPANAWFVFLVGTKILFKREGLEVFVAGLSDIGQ